MTTPAGVQPRLTAMRRRHIPHVVAIEQQVYDQPWSGGLFESELGQHDRHYITAWSEGVVRRSLLGYGGVMLAVDEAHITTVVVDPAVQRRGIGSIIMLDLLDAAIRMGAGAATLEVRAGNVGAQRLYSGFGFAPVGVRPGYYAASNEDAIIMWVYDINGADFRARLDRRRVTDGTLPRRVHPAPERAAPERADADRVDADRVDEEAVR